MPALNAIVMLVGGVLLVALAPPEAGGGTSVNGEVLASVAGLLAGLAAATAAQTAIWLLAGGKPSSLVLGLGAPRWTWQTSSGTVLALTRLPITVGAWGISRWRLLRRVPSAAVLVLSLAILVGGVTAMLSGLPPGPWAATLTAMFASVSTLLPLQPPGHWAGTIGQGVDYHAEHAADRVRRALFLHDYDAILCLTDPMPMPSDDMTVASRGYALAHHGRYDEAIALARTGIEASADPLFVHLLAMARHQAMEAGDPAGVAARQELHTLAEVLDDPAVPHVYRWDVEAVAALADGDYEQAERLATLLVVREPRRHRAPALCTIARAQAGMARFDEARATLARARAAHPDEPRVAYAEAAIARVESGEDLTAASH